MKSKPANKIQDLQFFGEFGGVNPSISDSSTYTFLSANSMSETFEGNTGTLQLDFLDYEEQEEIKWFIEDNEIVIDDTLNKKINMGSENNKWALEDKVLFLKEKHQKLNKNIFLKKVL